MLLAPAAALNCGRRKATGFPGYCLVALRDSRSVAAVDLDRFNVRKRIALDASPELVVADANAEARRAFVLAPDAGAVYEIDAAGLELRRVARIGSKALGMRLAPGHDALWALCREPSALVEIPLKSFRPARRIPLPAPPDAFDLSADGKAAVASRSGRSITIAALARGAVERVIPAGAEVSLVRFRGDGRLAIAGSAPDRSLAIFDVASGRTVVRLPVPLAPRRFCMTGDGGQLFVTGEGMDAVVIAFPYTTEIDQTILAGHAPGAMAVTDTSPAYLLVANPGSDSITALDIDTRKLVAVVRVGQGPGEIVLTPDRQYALTLNETSGDMAVIRLATFSEPGVRSYKRLKSASLFTMIPLGERPVGAAVVRVG